MSTFGNFFGFIYSKIHQNEIWQFLRNLKIVILKPQISKILIWNHQHAIFFDSSLSSLISEISFGFLGNLDEISIFVEIFDPFPNVFQIVLRVSSVDFNFCNSFSAFLFENSYRFSKILKFLRNLKNLILKPKTLI